MNEKEYILLVEDDQEMRETCHQVFEEGGYHVLEAPSPAEAKDLFLRNPVDLVITDLKMPQGGGKAVLEMVKEVVPDIPVIFITAYPTVNSAIDAFKGGALDYLLKPFSGKELLDATEKALGQRRAKDRSSIVRSTRKEDTLLPEMIGSSPAFGKLLVEIRQAAMVDFPLLIEGETGSGKELVARAIHRHSKRCNGPFMIINCAALPEHLLEAELFGFEKGTFTDARTSKPGLVEVAEGGILFLDEIGEMKVSFQAKLLRCLEEKKSRRLGGLKDIPLDIRVLSATSKNLEEDIKYGRFRDDLFFRLSALEIKVPPLRDRPQDIPLLCVHFMDRFSGEVDRTFYGFSEEAMDFLVKYPFPGNIRELQNILKKIILRCQGPVIELDDILRSVSVPSRKPGASGAVFERVKALRQFEREHIRKALDLHDGNVTRTARNLGIHRTTLQRLMKKYNLTGK